MSLKKLAPTDQVPTLQWEVGSTFDVPLTGLRQLLGEPYYIETDSTRTAGGDEYWWVFCDPDDTYVAVSLNGPGGYLSVCLNRLSGAAIEKGRALLAPFEFQTYPEPLNRSGRLGV
jgi:hypothetical protein